MARRRTTRWFSIAAALCTSAVLTACKQSEGDRCEVTNDCTAGLLCDNPTGTSGHCTSMPGTNVVDAAIPVTRLDTGVTDAIPDVVRDAARDAAPDVAPDSPDAPPDVAPDLASEAAPRDALVDAVPVD